MFAFVIWDSQTNHVFAARDQVGVKPLYYHFEDGLLVIGSELRTIMEHPAVDKRLDEAGVLEYLAFGHASLGRTIVENVHTLPPGHSLTLEGGHLRVTEYWDALPAAMPAPDPGAVESALLKLLDESVAASLVSDVPLALMLSGGFDSSTVARLAVDHVPASDLLAYSVAFGRHDDEAEAAGRFARELGIQHRTLSFDKAGLAARFETWAETMDVPCSNPTWLAVTEIAAAAREDGIKVLIGGDGGDELFGGYSRWMKYLRFHDRLWSNVPPGVRAKLGGALQGRTKGLARDIAGRARLRVGELFIGSRPFHEDQLARSRRSALGRVPRALLAGRFDPRSAQGVRCQGPRRRLSDLDVVRVDEDAPRRRLPRADGQDGDAGVRGGPRASARSPPR